MSISDKTRKTLWGRSGNRCAICKLELVQEKDPFNVQLNLGEECHIISKKESGPRYEPRIACDYDDSDNLILMCCNHHKEIDTRIDSYPKEELYRIKSEHEQWVKTTLSNSEIETLETNEQSKLDNLLNFVKDKHDREMNITSCKEVLGTSEGLKLAFEEVEKIKYQLSDAVQKLKEAAPNYPIIYRDNKYHIGDVMFKEHTMLVQFYQAYSNSAEKSYLFLGSVEGLFTGDGLAHPFYPPKMIKFSRFDFSCNTEGQYGWRNQERTDEFFLSSEIIETSLDEFLRSLL